MSFIINNGSYTTTIDSSTLTTNQTINFPDTSGTVMVLSSTGGNLLDMFYPVGTIYMTADANFNPNTSWGGTWTKIENRFLYGSGTKDIGTTGGEETVTLTTAELPEHYHDRGDMEISGTLGGAGFPGWVGCTGAFSGSNGAYGLYAEGGAWTVNVNMQASRNWTGTGTTVGENQAHNNMPPYEVVNIWKRTA